MSKWIALRERGSCRRHASSMARTPAGRTHRILEFQRGRGFGGHVPRAGPGGSPLA